MAHNDWNSRIFINQRNTRDKDSDKVSFKVTDWPEPEEGVQQDLFGLATFNTLAVVAQKPVTRDMLSQDQVVIFDEILAWVKAAQVDEIYNGWGDHYGALLKVGGLAGTGKTTVTAAVAAELADQGLDVAFCAFTGKAANVLARKLKSFGLPFQCTTLHSLIYRPIMDAETGTVSGWRLASEEEDGGLPFDLIVVDEASMLDAKMWDDLRTFNLPILAVGDHGQLPPVSADAVNLMANPDLRLEKIHRQAAGNPILLLAQWVRAGHPLRDFKPTDDRVLFVDAFPSIAPFVRHDHPVICFKNDTRVRLNEYVRKVKGYTQPHPQRAEQVILLRNAKPIFNGMRGVVEFFDVDRVNEFGATRAGVIFAEEGKRVRGEINAHQFNKPKTFSAYADATVGSLKPKNWRQVGLLFDYGYAMTCHKMQGSQAREVTVLVENWLGKTADDSRRWLYTAITRASDRVNIVFSKATR